MAPIDALEPPPGLSELDIFYFYRYKAMMSQYRDEESEDAMEKAFASAKALIADPDLPLLYAARAHMILSCNDEDPFFVQHAYEAVRILDEDCRAALDDPTNFPQKQYDEAVRLLNEAKAEATEQTRLKNAEPKWTPEEHDAALDREEAAVGSRHNMTAAAESGIGNADAIEHDEAGVDEGMEGLDDGKAGILSEMPDLPGASGPAGKTKFTFNQPTPGTSKASSRMPTNEAVYPTTPKAKDRAAGLGLQVTPSAPTATVQPGPMTAMGAELGRFNIDATSRSAPTDSAGTASSSGEQQGTEPPRKSDDEEMSDAE